MTAIVGVLCTDGVVIATDSSATFAAPGFSTIEQPTEKLKIVADRIIIAGTGQVGLGQRFERIVDRRWQGKHFKNDPIECAKDLCAETVSDFQSTGATKGQYGALLAFPCAKSFNLCEFSIHDFQPEMKLPYPKVWHVSMGSGQMITDPFMALLRQMLWPAAQPNIREGTFAALWAVEHAIECNAGGVNGPARLAVLQKDGSDFKARLLSEADLAEHRQAIDEVQGAIRGALQGIGKDKGDTVDVPKPVAESPKAQT